MNMQHLTLNLFVTDSTPVCGRRFEHAEHITVHVSTKETLCKKNSIHFEANTLELLENLKINVSLLLIVRVWFINK